MRVNSRRLAFERAALVDDPARVVGNGLDRLAAADGVLAGM
jgi:hypothetical protein